MNKIIKNHVIEGSVRCTLKGEIYPHQSESGGIGELLHEERLKAYQMGKLEGEKIGYEKAKQESVAFLNLLQAITDKLLEYKKQVAHEIKPELIEFALAVCENIIREELSEPKRLIKLIDSHLTGAKSFFLGEALKIVLSPEDLAMLEGHLIKGVLFSSDPLMKRGDFRIETKATLLNFMIERELQDLSSKIWT